MKGAKEGGELVERPPFCQKVRCYTVARSERTFAVGLGLLPRFESLHELRGVRLVSMHGNA